MSLEAIQWQSDYSALKNQVLSHRQQGKLIVMSELQSLIGSSEKLQKQLQLFQGAQMEYEISSSEIARRLVIIENIRKQIALIPTLNDASPQNDSFSDSSARKSLSVSSSTPTTSRHSDSAIFNPLTNQSLNTTSNEGLVQRQQQIIKKQDEIIVDIGKGVDILHNQALEINQEAKQHIQIIEKLDSNVDKAVDELRTEAAHANKIRQTSDVCYMYICVVIEVIIIVILIIVVFRGA